MSEDGTVAWTLEDAGRRFGAIVDAALQDGPQAVLRGGEPAVVVVSAAEYERMRGAPAADRPDFVEHLLSIPPDDGDDGDDGGRDRIGAAPRPVRFG